MRGVTRVGIATTFFCMASIGNFTACGNNQVVPPTAPTPLPAPSPSPQPLRRTIAGLVREVNGGPLAGVTIYATANGHRTYPQVASTAADGSFRLEQFAAGGLGFSKDGYDDAWWTVSQDAGLGDTLAISVKMPQTLRVVTNSMISSVVTADDLTYRSEDAYPFWSGEYLCSPCKFITVPNNPAGATLRLAWSGGAALTLWAGDAYDGPAAQASGQPGEAQLVLSVPAGRSVNTVMVGVDRKRDPSQVLNGTVTFTLAVEGPR